MERMEIECNIGLHATFEQQYEDLTLEPFEYQYPLTEMVNEHKFVHMNKGVYKAEPSFFATTEEINEIIRTYRDLQFYGYDAEGGCEIQFALSRTGCCISYECHWWDNEAFDNITEVLSIRENTSKALDWYAYNNSYFVVVSAGEEEKPLPEKKQAMNFIYRRYVREDGTVPRIMLYGYIGDMVEPGIYYFHKQRGECLPELSLNLTFNNQDVAVVAHTGYGISMSATVSYMAIDKKYFPRLKQIADSMKWCFYHEYKNSANQLEKEADSADCVEGEIFWQLPEGDEIISGIGKKNVELCFEIPLVEKREFNEYDYVVKNGNYLYLVDECKKKVEKYDMRLMTYLAVRQTVNLRCGYEYDAILTVIDCEKQKYKEILSPEAYALYEEQWKNMMM